MRANENARSSSLTKSTRVSLLDGSSFSFSRDKNSLATRSHYLPCTCALNVNVAQRKLRAAYCICMIMYIVRSGQADKLHTTCLCVRLSLIFREADIARRRFSNRRQSTGHRGSALQRCTLFPRLHFGSFSSAASFIRLPIKSVY